MACLFAEVFREADERISGHHKTFADSYVSKEEFFAKPITRLATATISLQSV